MTPIRVRGKRGPNKPGKKDFAKRRKLNRKALCTPPEHNASPNTHSPPPGTRSLSRRQRTQHDPELSRLEELPTEVLQSIFEFSANVNLPLASPRLASQLASRHLHLELTSDILHPVLHGGNATKGELAAAMRLMNCKFFTWSFFQGWLHHAFQRFDLLREWQEAISENMRPERQAKWTWHKLSPHSGVLPPKKLLCGPFAEDKVQFLNFIVSSFRDEPDELDPLYTEFVKEGLHQAVSEGAEETLPAFWTLGMRPDTELLREAVIDANCKKEVVRRLVTRVVHLTSGPIDVDFLDPALWSWAEKAKAAGDERGPWLIELLKEASGASGFQKTDSAPVIS